MTPEPGKWKCVIVDDDEANRKWLERCAQLNESLEIVASLGDGIQGLNYLQNHPEIDILFLDVEMPGMNGIDMLRSLSRVPETILTTSHKDFALDAYELQVADYLVKPVDQIRFNKSVSKVLGRLNNGKTLDTGELYVKVNQKMVKLNLPEVLYVEALSDYVIIITTKQKYIVYSTLKAIEEKLPSSLFMRIHRSYIINLRCIDSIEDNSVVIKEKYLPISKTFQGTFYDRINRL